jgi:hypothetical protein
MFALTILLCITAADCAPVHHKEQLEQYETMHECLKAAVFAFEHVASEFQEMAKTVKCERLNQ